MLPCATCGEPCPHVEGRPACQNPRCQHFVDVDLAALDDEADGRAWYRDRPGEIAERVAMWG